MKSVKHFNSIGDPCPVCKTKENKETTLIPIAGTQKDHNVEAMQVHVDCIDLCYYPERNLFAQVLEKEEKEVESF